MRARTRSSVHRPICWKQGKKLKALDGLGMLLLMANLLFSCNRIPGGPRPPVETEVPGPVGTPAARVALVDDGAPLAPQVIAHQPGRGQELPNAGALEITFDQEMDPRKTAAAWKVSGPEGSEVTGKISWPTPRTLRFTPAQPLQPGELYQASLSEEAASAAGLPLSQPFAFHFQTIGELHVSQVFPAPDTGEVANNAVITAIFNRPVAPLVIAEQAADLPNPLEINPPVEGHGEWVNTSVYAFRPTKALRGATSYTVVVKGGLQDAVGESQLAEDYSWQFTTTAPSIGSFELSDFTVNPPDFFKPIRLDEYFTINFLQPMDPQGTGAALTLAPQGGAAATLTTVWNADATRVVITPTQRLEYGTNYHLSLSAQALAADGGTLREGLSWNFATVPLPAIDSISPNDLARQIYFDGNLQIDFASPMRLDTVKDKIVISPAPKERFEWWYNDWDWIIGAYILEPSTSYQVTILPGMEDIYGSKITQGQTVRFTTGPYEPRASLQMPYQPALLRTDGPQEFYAGYRNVQNVALKLFRLSNAQAVAILSNRTPQYELDPPAEDLVWELKKVSTGKRNEWNLEKFQFAGPDGKPLPPGPYFLGLDSDPVFHQGPFVDSRIVIVAGANLTFKTTSTDALVWLTGLASGNPVAGSAITIYDKNFQAVGSGTTSPAGLLHLSVPAPADPYEQRFAISADADHFAFASSEWGSGISMYEYGIWSSYYSPANRPTVYVYTDRPIYRPGQPVYFKGIVRLDDDLAYSLPDQSEVKVSIESYAEKVSEQVLPLSAFGSFDGQLLLDRQATLGYYNLTVRFPGSDDVIGAVSFNVAEYRKPEFLAEVTTSPEDVLAGENYTASIQADYFSGGGVAGAQVKWTVTAAPYSFTPPEDLVGYEFSDFESDAGLTGFFEQPVSEVIAEGQGQTDARGHLSLTLPADLSGSNTSRSLVFEATVTDLAGNAVSDRATVTAHRSAIYLGARPKEYVGVAGEAQTIAVVAVDWDGKPIPGQKMSVEIVERRWYSVQEQDVQGRVEWKTSVEDIPVTSFAEVTANHQGQAEVSFTPPNGGVFQAKLSGLDARGNLARAATYLWVSGTSFIPWRQTNDRSFQLVSDRAAYTPGDTAEILIASPFQGQNYALVSVERGHIRYREVVLLESNSTIYKLPVTPDMAPNVYLSVVIVKGVDEFSTRPDFKIGMLELKVDTRRQAVSVEVIPDREQAGPGEQVSYTVRTQDADGQPVSAEVSLGLSDLATLSLLGPNSAPILDHFYAHRTLSVWTSIPIVLSLEAYNASIAEEEMPDGQGGGSGGKGGGDLGVLEVRGNFPDTAYWEAHAVTGQNGETSVTVTLPDNLTTWRMDARAVTLDTRVGQITRDIISTRPLLVRPQTPRFFVMGDQARLGAAVHNNTEQPLSVSVSLDAVGVTLQSEAVQVLEMPAKTQAYVAWETTVNPQAQRVDLMFSVEGRGPGGETYRDASLPTAGTLDNQGLPVYRYEAHETVGTSGQMTSGGSRLEAILLPEAYAISSGSLQIKVSPSLAAGMTDGLAYLEHYPYECVEQIISRFLPNVISTRAMRAAGLSDPALEAGLETQVNNALQRLYNWQNPDGGWGWWSNAKSDLQTSAYVVFGLVEAQESGYGVNEAVLNRGVSYLRSQVLSLTRLAEPHKLNRQAFVLFVLARAGSPDVSKTVQLFEQRQQTMLYARAYLADTLYRIDPGDPRLQTLLSDFTNLAITSATGSHWEESEPDRWNWNTDVRTTAIVLSALNQIDPQNPLNANAVRWLMSSRTNGHWNGTQETAWTLMALTSWIEASGELQANYNYGVALNGQRLGDGVASAEMLRQSLELRLDVSELLPGAANRLLIARDDGPGNLYYTAHLDVSLPVEQVAPLNQGVIVSRAYYQQEETGTPIVQAALDDLVLVRLTVVAPHDLHYVVIDDPLPAGLEAIDQSLNTSQQAVTPQAYAWDDLMNRGWGWWYFSHVALQDEKLVLSANHLPAGTYVYTYLARASTAGTFRTIPPTAQEFYFPEVYGRGAGSLFTVTP